MGFFKFRSKDSQGADARGAAAAAPAESVESMRRRARHRLLGAAVLVLAGVIGFPLLFDSQPRPIAVDIPIEVPDRNTVRPLQIPATPAAPAASTSAGDAGGSAPLTRSPSSGMITERADGTEIVAGSPSTSTTQTPPTRMAAATPPEEKGPEPKPAPRPESKPDQKPEHKPEAKPEPRHESKPETSRTAEAKPEVKPPTAKPAARGDDGARALALLEGRQAAKPADPKPPSSKPTDAKPVDAKPAEASGDSSSRFVVQVGAFADADKAKEARQKLEKAGLKTYTTVAKTAGGERTRVRVGPFTSKTDADRAAERIKGLALPASVLAL